LVSDDWPRPESEWKDKEFVLAASAPVPTQIRGFRVIAKWAPASAKSTRRWTTRVGHRCHDQTNLAVEEKLKNIIPRDFNRMKWEIETPWSQAVVKVSVAILVAIQIKLSLLVWTNCMCGSDSTITFRGSFNFSCHGLWNVHHDKRSLRMGLLEGNKFMVRNCGLYFVGQSLHLLWRIGGSSSRSTVSTMGWRLPTQEPLTRNIHRWLSHP